MLQPLNGITCADGRTAAIVLAAINSFAFDFVARLRFTGRHLNVTTFSQMPLPKSQWNEFVVPRVLELTFTGWDIDLFANDCGWLGPPFRWDQDRRFMIRCELDAAFFHLYLSVTQDGQWKPARVADGAVRGETPDELAELKKHFPTPREAVSYIMDTFPIVRRKDEEKYGEYRTKRAILEIYDEMAEAMRTGTPYQTRLDPPPGPPMDASGKILSYDQIANNPPSHIHLFRDIKGGTASLLQLSDLCRHFPKTQFSLRLSTSSVAPLAIVTPVRTAELTAGELIVIAAPSMLVHGAKVPAAIGKLSLEFRIDAASGKPIVFVSIRGEDGIAQARFSEEEWRDLTSIGRIEYPV
jgi:hypothetical protein